MVKQNLTKKDQLKLDKFKFLFKNQILNEIDKKKS